MVAWHTLALRSPNGGSSPPLSGPVSAFVTHLMEDPRMLQEQPPLFKIKLAKEVAAGSSTVAMG